MTEEKRKVVEEKIEENAQQSSTTVSYLWKENEETLHITVDPVLIEVKFLEKIVELYAEAPLWARLLLTDKKKNELRQEVEALLHKAEFITAKKAE
ncbi:hypothetical protein [Beijerinckia indica]|uniref:hypothetical protein n=1 Tax=Beijerinckia indica TaxID=533 RepID=UPI0002E3B24B|nr:hypothetical protein [Beijerinckia indica]